MDKEIYDFTMHLLEDDHNKFLRQLYKQALQHTLSIWQRIQENQDRLEAGGAIEPSERIVDSRAEYDPETGVLGITIDDVLPRWKDDVRGSLLSEFWMGNIFQALRNLEARVRFKHALCTIIVYGQRDVGHDVDNRAISYIINGLRASQVISGDEYDKLSLTLLGGVDKKSPRTEIWLVEYSDEGIWHQYKGKKIIPVIQ